MIFVCLAARHNFQGIIGQGSLQCLHRIPRRARPDVALSSAVRIRGIALGWIGATTAFVLLSESRRLDAALGSACTYIVLRSPLKVVQSEQRPVLIQRRASAATTRDVGDGRSACARRWRQAPAHCHAISVPRQCCGSLVRDDPETRNEISSSPHSTCPTYVQPKNARPTELTAKDARIGTLLGHLGPRSQLNI